MFKKTKMRKDAKQTLDNLLKMSRQDQEYCIGLFLIYKVYNEKMFDLLREHEDEHEIAVGPYKNSIVYLETLEKFRKEFK